MESTMAGTVGPVLTGRDVASMRILHIGTGTDLTTPSPVRATQIREAAGASDGLRCWSAARDADPVRGRYPEAVP